MARSGLDELGDEVADSENLDTMREQLLASGMSNAHVAESVRLVQAALQVVPVPPVVQSQSAGFSASAN